MLKTPLITLTLACFFLSSIIGPLPQAMADEFRLPAPGVMVHLSPPLDPPLLKGIKVHPDNPFQFDFILDKGDSELSQDALKAESDKLIKYFLAALTIPDKDLWVNLSPYEKDRIIPGSFGLTEMGRDLLAEDYLLKQITASLIYPEDETGKKFWKRIYEEAAKRYGTTNIPVNTFNKVWIVPDKAVVYENAQEGAAYVVESKLKVMLEQDYLSIEKHTVVGARHAVPLQNVNQLGSQIVREIVIPELTTEINENKNFARLRQVYNSLILAVWYKEKIKDSILSQVYSDKNKVAGVNIDNPKEKDEIYQRYLKAFKKGVYNYIKEDIDPVTLEAIPRKYFSGGVNFAMTNLMTPLRIINEKTASPGMLASLKTTAKLAVVFATLTFGSMNIRAQTTNQISSVNNNSIDSTQSLLMTISHESSINVQTQAAQKLGSIVLGKVTGEKVDPHTPLPILGTNAVSVLLDLLKKNPNYQFEWKSVGKDGKQTVDVYSASDVSWYLQNHALEPTPLNIGVIFQAINELSQINTDRINQFIRRLSDSREPSSRNSLSLRDLGKLLNNKEFPDAYDIQLILERLQEDVLKDLLTYEIDRNKGIVEITLKNGEKIEQGLFSLETLQKVPANTNKPSKTILYALVGVFGFKLLDGLRHKKNLDGIKDTNNDLKFKSKSQDAVTQMRNMAAALKDFFDPKPKQDLLNWVINALGLSLDADNLIKSLNTLKVRNIKSGDKYVGLIDEVQALKNAFDSIFYPLDEARIDDQLSLKKDIPSDLLQQKAAELRAAEFKASGTIFSVKALAQAVLEKYPAPAVSKKETPSKETLYSFKEKGYALASKIGEVMGHQDTVTKGASGVYKMMEDFRGGDDIDYYLNQLNDYNNTLLGFQVEADVLAQQALNNGQAWSDFYKNTVDEKLKDFSTLLDRSREELERGELRVPFANKIIELTRRAVGKLSVKKISLTPALADQAMKGGIDLTPANMHLQMQNIGGEIKFRIDPAMLEKLQNAPGFTPVIINIRPLNSLPEFLGINETKDITVDS